MSGGGAAWAGQFTRTIKKIAPAIRSGRLRTGRSNLPPTRIARDTPTRRRSKWRRLKRAGTARQMLLDSPMRWLVSVTLGFLLMREVAMTTADKDPAILFVFNSRNFLALIALVVPLLWCASFAATPSFRVVGSGVLLATTPLLLLFGGGPLGCFACGFLSLVLLLLAFEKPERSLGGRRSVGART